MKLLSSNRIISAAYWVLALAFMAVVALRVIIVFSFVPETGGVSVNVLFSIVRMINGYALYADPQLPPYPVVQYTPLHYFIVSLIGKFLHIGGNVHAVSVLNRFICLSFDLLVFIPVSKILKNIFSVPVQSSILKPSIIKAACMCIFLILPNPNYGRVDNLYLFLFAFAVYFFLQYLSRTTDSYRNLIYSAVAISLGIFTKQSGLFLLAGTGLYLLFFNRNLKTIFVFSSTVAGTFLVLFLLMVNKDYHAFYQNVVLGLKNGISISWFNEVIIKSFFYKTYFFVACGLALAAFTFIEAKDARLKYMGTLSIIVFCCSVMASLKWGSSTNYFTEFLAITFILAAVYISTHYTNFSIAQQLLVFFITPFFIMTVYNDKGWGNLGALKKSKRLYDETVEVKNYLDPKLKKEDLVFTAFHRENLLNILLYDHAVFPHREIVMHCTYPKKTFDYSDFQNENEKGNVKYLVGNKDEQPTEFLNVSFNHFVPDTVIGDFGIWRYSGL